MKILRFFFYVSILWFATVGLIRFNELHPQKTSGRYQLHVAEDGEVAVFDTATGEAVQIHKGSGEAYFIPREPASKTQPVPQQQSF